MALEMASKSSHNNPTSKSSNKLLIRMSLNRGVLTVAIFLLVATGCPAARAGCPSREAVEPCECKVSFGVVTSLKCDAVDEDDVSKAIGAITNSDYEFYFFTFTNSTFNKISKEMFGNLIISSLNISGGMLSVIEEDTFADLGNSLDTLDLSNNDIVQIPKKVFDPLRQLTELKLESNGIKDIPGGSFSGLQLLFELSLRDNEIQLLSEDSFEGLENLNKLDLAKNQLTAIPIASLKPFSHLLLLDLSENLIQSLPADSFAGLKINRLNLEMNTIVIEDFAFRGMFMEQLIINHNQIIELTNNTLVGVEDTLFNLQMSHNLLEYIPSDALQSLRALTRLDISYNEIKELSNDSFSSYNTKIEHLLLDGNQIESIEVGTFLGFDYLFEMHLDHNLIRILTEETMEPILDTLDSLDVSNNAFICDWKISWLQKWIIKKEKNFNYDETLCFSGQDNRTHSIEHLPQKFIVCDDVPITTVVVPVSACDIFYSSHQTRVNAMLLAMVISLV